MAWYEDQRKRLLAGEAFDADTLGAFEDEAKYAQKQWEKEQEEKEKQRQEAWETLQSETAEKEVQKQAEEKEKNKLTLGKVLGGIGGAIKNTPSFLKKEVVDPAAKGFETVAQMGRSFSDDDRVERLNTQRQFVQKQFEEGKISKEEFNSKFQDIRNKQKNLGEEIGNRNYMKQDRAETAGEAATAFLDVATLGVGGSLIGRGGRKVAEKGVKEALEETTKNTTGRQVRRGVTEGGAIGTEYGAIGAVRDENEDVDWGDVGIGAITGGGLGGVLGGLAGSVGGRLSRGSREEAQSKLKSIRDQEAIEAQTITDPARLIGSGLDRDKARLEEIEDIRQRIIQGEQDNQLVERGPEGMDDLGTPRVTTQSPELMRVTQEAEEQLAQIDDEIARIEADREQNVLDNPRLAEEQKNIILARDAEIEAVKDLPRHLQAPVVRQAAMKAEQATDELVNRWGSRDELTGTFDDAVAEAQTRKIQLEEDLQAQIDEITAREAETNATKTKEALEYTPEQLREMQREQKAIQERLDRTALAHADEGGDMKLKVEQPQTKEAVVNTLDEVQRQEPSTIKNIGVSDYVRVPLDTLRRIGAQKEAKLIEKSFESKRKADWADNELFKDWRDVVPDEETQTRIFRYLDGADETLSPSEMAMARDIRGWLQAKGKEQGLDENSMIGDYITHVFKNTDNAQSDAELQKLLKKGTPGVVAEDVMKTPAQQARNQFLKKRYGVEGYEEDLFGALSAYSQASNRKIHMSPALEATAKLAGQDGLDGKTVDYLLRYNRSMAKQKADIDKTLDNLTGDKGSPFLRTIRKLSYNATLGGNVSTALNNLTQVTNTFAEMGIRDTALGYTKMAKLLGDATRQHQSGRRVTAFNELFEEGVFDDTIQSFEASSNSVKNKILRTGDRGLWAMFDTSEKLNRGAAYLAAKNKGLRKGMSEDEARTFGRETVSKTQFKFNEVESPLILQSEVGKTLGQLQSFNLRQTGYIGGIAKGVAKGDKQDIARAIRWAGMNLGVISSIGAVTGYEWYDGLPFIQFRGFSPPIVKGAQLAWQGATGTDQYGEDVGLAENAKRIGAGAAALFAPGGTQIKKSIEGVNAYNQGYSETASGKVRFPIEKNADNKFTTALFGQYATPEGQEFYNRDNPFAKQMGRQGKSMTEEETKMFQGASPAKQKMYYDFFDAANDIEGREAVSKDITKLVKQGEVNKAQRRANEWNAQVESKFQSLNEEYAGMIPGEIVDFIEDKKIDAAYKSVKQRKSQK